MDRTTLFRKSEANDNGRWFRIKSDSLCFRQGGIVSAFNCRSVQLLSFQEFPKSPSSPEESEAVVCVSPIVRPVRPTHSLQFGLELVRLFCSVASIPGVLELLCSFPQEIRSRPNAFVLFVSSFVSFCSFLCFRPNSSCVFVLCFRSYVFVLVFLSCVFVPLLR